MPRSFTPAFFGFLRELSAHNDRDWFEANKARYQSDVEAPMLRFIADLGPKLRKIQPGVIVEPKRSGGSMQRIYRDTRFSADKTPYKTSMAAHFRMGRGEMGTAPGFYIHLEPGEGFGGGGIYHPEPPALAGIRERIVEKSAEWAKVRGAKIAVEGESLKRVPRGFDPEHKFAEDLKRKDFYAMDAYTEKQACAPDFLDRYLATCKGILPLMKFLEKALG